MNELLNLVIGGVKRAVTNKKGKKSKVKNGVEHVSSSIMNVREPGEKKTAEVWIAYAIRAAIIFGVVWAAKQAGIDPAEILQYL